MKISVGDRVGAILSATADTVHLLGYGVYEGYCTVPDLDVENPKIRLDDGRIVWGYQCWWGSEEVVRARIGDRKIVPATIED